MRKRTEKEIVEIVTKLGYNYIQSYFERGSNRKVIIKDKDGYKYDVYLNSIMRKKGISPIDKRNPFSLENVSLWLKLNNSQFELFGNNKYERNKSKLNLYCNRCKDYPKMSWHEILQRNGCGVCHGLQVGLHHNLKVQRPDIAKEWHPIKNGNLTPKDVTYGSKRKVHWLCPNGHDYFSSVGNRTSGRGCKICSDVRQESKIATELKRYILNKYNAKEEYKIFRNPDTNYFLPFDIYVFGGVNLEINGIYIEVHGEQHYKLNAWHKRLSKNNKDIAKEKFENQKHRDRLKRRFARKNGIYIEVDLRKIKSTEDAIKYIETIFLKKGN